MKSVVLKKHNTFLDNYNNIGFLIKHSRGMSGYQFDDFVSNKANLFTTDAQFDFENTEFAIDKIISSLGAMKRIFAKPIIDLIDTMNIMAVETVRKIHSKTIDYSISHIETIDNIYKDGSVKPNRLLSNEYKILYETYENKCFCYCVNLCLKFVKINLAKLSNYLFLNKEEINVNILERLNHNKYYLAVGKLQTSYLRNFNKSFEDVERLMDKLLLINSTLMSRLNSKVYVRCKKAKRNKVAHRLQLKKTNIFRNQKNYKRVYDLTRYLLINYEVLLESTLTKEEINKLVEPYYQYCKTLALFSMYHFNFETQSNKKINLKKLSVNAKFKSFKISINEKSANKIRYLLLEFKKEKKYRIVLYNVVDEDKRDDDLVTIKKKIKADEYIVCSPFAGAADAVYISINNIDSFRRIQQIMLRGMIMSDSKHNICPFCGEKLTKHKKEKNVYECFKCHTVIAKKVCPNTKHSYYSTTINNYKAYLSTLSQKNRKAYLSTKNLDSNMYFRNITKFNFNLEEVCPWCGDVHEDFI